MKFRDCYNNNSSGIDKLNKPLSTKNIEAFMLQLHIAWCSYLKNDKEYDVL